jgi:hypothetical protein
MGWMRSFSLAVADCFFADVIVAAIALTPQILVNGALREKTQFAFVLLFELTVIPFRVMPRHPELSVGCGIIFLLGFYLQRKTNLNRRLLLYFQFLSAECSD